MTTGAKILPTTVGQKQLFFAWKSVLNIKNNSSIRHFNGEITPYYVILKTNKN